MNVTQIKKVKDLEIQPPSGFTAKVSNAQGMGTGVENKGKEDASYLYDFDSVSEECFAVDQLWAIYDPLDDMPRWYARINKVYGSPFKVDVTWLEYIAGDVDQKAWDQSGLPVACGKFKLGETATIDYISERDLFDFYPREGETWELYKNWKIEWSSDPDNHSEYEYESVVVLSDYISKAGISASYLVKAFWLHIW
ncbi:hypothetical protein MKX03_036010 [Papaver bracteatum]|nr:hypothetical protein MKX03_036010 [Papaver bracteatum]